MQATADSAQPGALPAHRYAPRNWAEVVQLVQAHPLAWIVSEGAGLQGTPLPLRARLDAEGRIVGIGGHFARTNPHVQALLGQPPEARTALILFMGANGYVSPSWMADRTQAPTWVYATAAFQTRLDLFDDPARIAASLQDLTSAHEQGRERAWRVEEMGERYARLARGVVGFEAEVLSVTARFKLGQDEREDVFADILKGLAAEGQGALAAALWRPEP